jgi:NADPH2:quinone reductase
MRAVRVEKAGGPDVLNIAEVPVPSGGQGLALVQVRYAGVNFIDVYHREGAYPLPLPTGLGLEGVGVDEQGKRLAWCSTLGSYAEYVAVPRDSAVEVPAGVPDEVAAAALLQGMTAHYLITSVHKIKPGDVALVHAAAGGVGLLLTQLIHARGGIVIGTVSTPEKAEAARAAGATHVIGYDQISAKVRELTDGLGVHVAYDGVGKATFDESLASMRKRGMLALFGAASGQPDPFVLGRLASSGSISVCRPTLGDYTTTPEELAWRASELFDAYLAGSLKFAIGGVYDLAEVATAHRDLQSRSTSGKLLLKV